MFGKTKRAIIELVENGIAQTLAITSAVVLNFVFYGLELRNTFIFILMMLNVLYALLATAIGGAGFLRFTNTGKGKYGRFLRTFATAATLAAINIATLQLVAMTNITFDPPYTIQN